MACRDRKVNGVKDLADYLKEITGTEVPIQTTLDETAPSLIVVGKKMVEQARANVMAGRELGQEGYLVESVLKSGKAHLIVAGETPHGTKFGLAGLMKMIQAEGQSICPKAPGARVVLQNRLSQSVIGAPGKIEVADDVLRPRME